jgi:glycosyltransferase involved in cell wall biosynthesis
MGGAEYQIYLLINFLIKQKLNYHIYYIYENRGGQILNHLNVHLLPLKRLKLNKRFGDRWFLHKTEIQNYLDKIQPDIIYTRSYSSWSGIAAEYTKSNNCIHFWALASDRDLYRLKSPVSFFRPLDRIENIWVLKAFKEASHIITQNNFQQELLSSLYGREGILIRQSVDEFVNCIGEKPTEKIRICWIANLKPLKQPRLFIDLANKFKDDLPEIEKWTEADKKKNDFFEAIGRGEIIKENGVDVYAYGRCDKYYECQGGRQANSLYCKGHNEKEVIIKLHFLAL